MNMDDFWMILDEFGMIYGCFWDGFEMVMGLKTPGFTPNLPDSLQIIQKHPDSSVFTPPHMDSPLHTQIQLD